MRRILVVFDDFRANGLLRPAAEKFGGAWLACFLVMARGDILAGFSFEHIRRPARTLLCQRAQARRIGRQAEAADPVLRALAD